MYGFLTGMIVGAAIAAVAYHFGHSTATRYWKTAVDSLTHVKLKLEDDVQRLKNKLP